MITTAAVLVAVYIAILTGGDLYLIFCHLRWSSMALARERRDLAAKYVPADVPYVCVQLPIYNEPAHVAESIGALCRLDWPKEKLEILVLDDSTDETLDIALASASTWRSHGYRLDVLHREHREQHKAGALAAGLSATKAPFIAIFDADYRPNPCCLRDMMNVLLSDRALAFVQARLDHRNRNQNWLTRAQALELDTQIAYEHAARNWAGIPMMFSGTCAVWRREAIEAANGWSGRSLAEDQDLSYRVYALGWRSRILVSIPVSGELPDTFAALRSQRQRWSTGAAQVLRRMPWSLIHHLRWRQAAAFWLLAQFNTTSASLLMMATLASIAAWLFEPARAGLAVASLCAALGMIVLTKTVASVLAARTLGRHLGIALILDILAMWLLQAVLLPTHCVAFLQGIFSSRNVFVRTPKRGC